MNGKYRGAYRRMFKIDEIIREEKYPSAKMIAEKVGVSKRTVFRDIRYMEVELSAPIIFDEEHGGYCYAYGNYSLSDFAFTDDDVSLLTLSRQIMESLFDATFYKSKIKEAFDSIATHAGNMPKILEHTIRRNIEVVLPNSGNFKHAELVTQAMDENLCVIAVKKGNETLIRPIRLIYAWSDWYLLYITEEYKDNEDFYIEKLDCFDGFKQTGKAASQRVKDIVANVDEWDSQLSARGSQIEDNPDYGEVLHIIIQGKADAFNLLYRKNDDGSLEFIKTKETMLGGHVLETILDMAEDVKLDLGD